MLENVKDVFGLTVKAKNGDSIGRAEDVLFDDITWQVRYLVVEADSSLPERKVLISPVAAGRPDRVRRWLPVYVTGEQVRRSPTADLERPVSRQYEMELHEHYRWPGYMAAWSPAGPRPSADDDDWDWHVRSARRILGYSVEASDGEIGQVEDFLLDCTTWMVGYIVVDMQNWWPGKKVLVASSWIEAVGWESNKLSVEMTRDSVKESPEFSHSRLGRG